MENKSFLHCLRLWQLPVLGKLRSCGTNAGEIGQNFIGNP